MSSLFCCTNLNSTKVLSQKTKIVTIQLTFLSSAPPISSYCLLPFSKFVFRIEWPNNQSSSNPKGYLYIIFEHEKQVRCLLSACTHDYAQGGSWYYKVSSRRMKNKEVQVIPWVITDSRLVPWQHFFPLPNAITVISCKSNQGLFLSSKIWTLTNFRLNIENFEPFWCSQIRTHFNNLEFSDIWKFGPNLQ